MWRWFHNVFDNFSFFWNKSTRILFRQQNAELFCETLGKYLHLFTVFNLEKNHYIVIQLDIAPIHATKLTQDWLRFNFVWSMIWPARSPDLILVENIWDCFTMKVYSNERQ